jgi:PilZ domain-containing protein
MFMPQSSLGAVIYQGESTGFREQVLRQLTSPSRRFTSRVEAPEDVWVYWRCNGFDDLSHVQNIGIGGLFIETPRRTAEGTNVSLSFLVREGQVRADAVVRHAVSGRGIGLKFRAVREEDRPCLGALLSRIRTVPR